MYVCMRACIINSSPSKLDAKDYRRRHVVTNRSLYGLLLRVKICSGIITERRLKQRFMLYPELDPQTDRVCRSTKTADN